MALDLSSLKKSLNSYGSALSVANKNLSGPVDKDLEQVIKAGVIQNFEFTFELCWKFMKRWLEKSIGESVTIGLSKKELFRAAAENKIITDVEDWFTYNEARNMTAQAYDRDTADDVYKIALKFYIVAKDFLYTLEQKND